jgi:hypothetical protein
MTETTIINLDAPTASARPLDQLQRECEELARTKPGDVHKIGSLLQQMILSYYQDVRRQAQQSFYCALGAAVVGTIFFIGAATLVMQPGQEASAKIGLIAGALIQVISAINFWLYGRAARQFAAFHICLERTNRFLLANTLCENLDSQPMRDQVRTELIQVVAHAPMLTLEAIGVQSLSRSEQAKLDDPASKPAA